MMSQEIRVVRFDEAHTLAQPNCPYCGDPLDWGKSKLHQHVTGFVMACECGTRLCPDFEGDRGVQYRSPACEKIADLRARLARVERDHLRRMLSSLSEAVERNRWFQAYTESEYERKKWRRRAQFTRFAKACRAKLERLRAIP